jgi:O-antigen/teichoic acid export membrane protein
LNTPEQLENAPGPMRRVFRNFALLLRGRGIAAVLLLGATAFMARALGPVEFGIVILMQTYVLLIRGLLNVKQFQGIIRYGVPALDAQDTQTLRRLIDVSRRIDVRSSLAATVVAVGLAPLLGPLLGMSSDQGMLLAAYSLVLLSSGTMTAVGLLRLFDRFEILGHKETIGPGIRFFGAAGAWYLNSAFVTYIGILAVSYLAENFYVSWQGRRVYRQHLDLAAEPRDNGHAAAKMADFPGLKNFLWVTYWQSNIDLIPKHVSVMLAGNLLGASDAGLLRLARQFSTLLAKPAVLIRQVVFLDLTRSWNQGSADFKLVAYRTAALGGAVGAIFVLAGYFFGDVLIQTIVGAEFVAAAPVLTLLLLAGTFELATSSLRSATYAIGHASKVLRLSVVSALIYLTLFTVLSLQLGLIGIGIAACAAAVFPPLVMAMLLRRSTRTIVG